jgi:hypothetical protein
VSYYSNKETEKNHAETIKVASVWTETGKTYLPNITLQCYVKSNMFAEG